MKTYSNPRISAVVDWPNGWKERVTATFSIETDPKRGQRAVRVTTGRPIKMAYARQVRIVDGDDGRIYIAELTAYGFVSVMRGDMKIQEEVIRGGDQRYSQVRALFDNGGI
jgi:hypothetical protein